MSNTVEVSNGLGQLGECITSALSPTRATSRPPALVMMEYFEAKVIISPCCSWLPSTSASLVTEGGKRCAFLTVRLLALSVGLNFRSATARCLRTFDFGANASGLNLAALVQKNLSIAAHRFPSARSRLS
jgi:hypothetical protein